MKNETNETLVVTFNEPAAAPYFLRPGESLPERWSEKYTVRSILIAVHEKATITPI